MTSAVLIIPAEHHAQAETFGVANGWGEGNYSVALSASGTAPATHWGCRAEVGQGFINMVTEPTPENEVLASVLIADFNDILLPYDHWTAVLEQHKLKVLMEDED